MDARPTRACWTIALLAACGGPATAPGSPASAPPPPDRCDALLWWNQPPVEAETAVDNDTGGVTTRWDLDYAVASSTPVQLRHDSQLLAQAVYPWGWQPTFLDLASGHVFRFLHLRPQVQLVGTVGAVYPAGTLVGVSGGDSWDTGYERPACDGRICSAGAHLCVEADDHVAAIFPARPLACPAGSPGAGGRACPADGLYCGGDGVFGDADTLYRCRGAELTVAARCPTGCEVQRSGEPDRCRAQAAPPFRVAPAAPDLLWPTGGTTR